MNEEKEYIDFVLSETLFYRQIFRFYKNETKVHGFGDIPPTKWEDVYKVYYSWAIVLQQPEDSSTDTQIMLDMYCDECSNIPNLSYIIKNVIETGKKFNQPTFGQPAADWTIKRRKYKDKELKKTLNCYDFMVFNNCTNQGFKFTLNSIEVLNFCNYLDTINAYALSHSEGI